MILDTYTEIDDIKIFHADVKENHQDYNAKGLDNLFAQEEKHFWFIARKEFIYRQMNEFVPKTSATIEIGAGTGNVSRYLKANGYTNLAVGEMHLNGLRYAKHYGIKDCYQFDLLQSPFKDEFNAVCMFDVLEHIENDTLALENVHHMLQKNGYVVLTVPTHMWLWNRDDTIAGHKRRYTRKELLQKLKTNGFEILSARYFFISIIPLLFVRALINRDDGSTVHQDEYNNSISINLLFNKLLLLISKIENTLNKFLPNWFGGSLLVIAQRKQ